MIDCLIEAFLTIDRDHTDQITFEALENYRQKNNFDETFITQWKQLFDANNTGVISLETFCDVLGLEIASIKETRAKHHVNEGAIVPSSILQIAEDMNLERRGEIYSLVCLAEQINKDNEREIVKWMKFNLDERFGGVWHVFVIRGHYFAYYSYEAGNSYCFKKGSRIYVVFKTPD